MTRPMMNWLGKFYGRMLKNRLESLKTLGRKRKFDPAPRADCGFPLAPFSTGAILLANNDIS
jgi:hypothetical protein